MIFEQVTERGHEQIVFAHDRKTGLRAIIAVHNSTLGKVGQSGAKASLGGTRRRCYGSEEEALDDVLRLSEGMTYKSAAAELELGGAKSVVLLKSKDEEKNPTEAEARAMGAAVHRLGGRYIAAEDMNVTEQYVDWMATETPYVIGGKVNARGGDPSPYTAQGVINSIRGGLTYARGQSSLEGVTLAIQGLGSIGQKIAKIARQQGADLIVADTRKDRVDEASREFGARGVSPDDIIAVECDVLCPCAVGQVVNDETIDGLKCEILAPGANNVLDDPEKHAVELKRRGVVYCPDFIGNAAGVIRLGGLWTGLSEAEIDAKIARIEQRVVEILKKAESSESAYHAAIEYALQRIEGAGAVDAKGAAKAFTKGPGQPQTIGGI